MDIFEAINKNNIEKVRELLDSDIDVNSKDGTERTPLHIACKKNYIEIIKLLLQHPNINVNIKNKDGNTALYLACKEGNIEVVKLLLEHPNINVNIKNKFGFTPLYTTCNYDNIEIAKLLVQHSKFKINFDITEFIEYPKIYTLLKKKQNNNLTKVSQILNTIEE